MKSILIVLLLCTVVDLCVGRCSLVWGFNSDDPCIDCDYNPIVYNLDTLCG